MCHLSLHVQLSPTNTPIASIYVAIQANRYEARMAPEVTKAADAAGFASANISSLLEALAQGTSDALDSVPGITAAVKEAAQNGIKNAYAQSYSTVYLSSLAFGGVALISCFFATNDLENYFTAFLNKTVDAPHPEGEGKDMEKVIKTTDRE